MRRAMFTDLYALTMGAAYLLEGQADRKVTCELFVRRLPRNRRFMVSAGLSDMLAALQEWELTAADVEYLRQVPQLKGVLTAPVLERLRRLSFQGDVWAMPEGTVFFPDEPVIRVTGSVLEAQLLETYLLSVFNHAASIASKAARVMLAAAGKPVFEFGMRRVHPDASVTASRVAFMMGLEASSNVAAGQKDDLPLTGTMAHAFVMVHDHEEAAFRSFFKAYPKSPTFLVDTYDTLQGVQRAMAVAGPALGAVRLDSGDLAELARGARRILDQGGMPHVKIVASGDLDEHKVDALIKAKAPVDIFAVGTELAASADAPTLGAVYKVVQDHSAGRGVAKFSASKSTLAGVHQVFRSVSAAGVMERDVIGLDDERPAGMTGLLQPVMKDGRLLSRIPRLVDSRAHAAAELARLPPGLRDTSLASFEPHAVTVSQTVKDVTEEARRRFAAAM